MTFGEILSTLLIGPLKLVFEIIFNLANTWINHPGYSIIILSLAMNILVLPLYRRADAMQEEARNMDLKLSKGIAHIKKTFTGDERMMILQTYYKQNNYSPLSSLNGSISLLLEIPFFMAAYQFLSHLEILKGVSLGPIKDLSAPDGLIVIGSLTLNLLPILMTAVNVISSALYLKGFPLKTKIQLYAMAAFFLVFLYTSPSGLVFYWTLNNVFSLVKTIFYKIKNPKKVLAVLTSIIGIAALIFALFFVNGYYPRRRLFLILLGIILEAPILMPVISKIFIKKEKNEPTPNKKVFLLGSLFLAILSGLLIPTTFISASPQEYVDITYFNHPLWYVVSAFCLSFGTFVIWMQVFYKLASSSGKAVFDKLIWVLCCLAFINYMFFGTKLGNISSTLKYDEGLVFTVAEQLINIAAIAVVCIIAYLIVKRWHKAVISILLTAVIALSGMSVLNISTIKTSVDKISRQQNDSGEVLNFNLSKDGKNVVVFFLDRAFGSYVPYIFNEKPELKEKYSGFTYYSNTISYGGHTNFAAPPIFGGYEYTPVEMNKRDSELLVDKHNEALKVLPTIFSKNNYNVVLSDIPYGNYSYISDLSIYDGFKNTSAFHSVGYFGNADAKRNVIENNKRNFFCFSIMKMLPLYFQPTIYNEGFYNRAMSHENISDSTVQSLENISVAKGIDTRFTDSYNVLTNLPNITKISESKENNFTFLYNETTHWPQLLQTPDYTLSAVVDNTEYDNANSSRFTLDGKTIHLGTPTRISHYHSNMAAFLKIGEWLDYLRENEVYDNTRIILVSDHGYYLHQLDELVLDPSNDMTFLELYFPLLMVKDFNSTGFKTSKEFMTNADVPTILTKGLIDNPKNPFTGKDINSNEKTAHDQYLVSSLDHDIATNNGYTFNPSNWMQIKDNIWDKNNWKYHNKETVLKEHSIN